MNLICNKMGLYSTPTEISYWCMAANSNWVDQHTKGWSLAKKASWLASIYYHGQVEQAEGMVSLARKHFGSWRTDPFIRYAAFCLVGNVTDRKDKHNRSYHYIDPTVFWHLRKLASMYPLEFRLGTNTATDSLR